MSKSAWAFLKVLEQDLIKSKLRDGNLRNYRGLQMPEIREGMERVLKREIKGNILPQLGINYHYDFCTGGSIGLYRKMDGIKITELGLKALREYRDGQKRI